MLWFLAAIGGIVLFIIIRGMMPSRQATALYMAAQRAAKARNFPAAATLCRRSHEIAEKLSEPQKSRIEAFVEILWATALYRQGKMRQAEDLFRTGFSKSRAAGCHTHVAPAYLFWGDLCADEGRHPEAEQHYRSALERAEKIGNLAVMIFDLQRLGDSLIRQGRRDEAEEAINRAMALETRVVHEQMIREGKDPSRHTVISWSLPDLHFCREQYEEARSIYRSKVEFWEKSVTRPENIDLGHLQMRLALSEARSGHRAEALEMLSRAEATFEREWCEGHPKVIAAREMKTALMNEAVAVSGE